MRFGILNEFAVTQQRITEVLDLVQRFSLSASGKIVEVSTAIARAFESGNKILICGNGGSAADSQHFAAEFVSSFSKLIKRQGLPAIALTVDTSILTAFSNDYGFEGVFARQVEAYGGKDDILIVLTTSGTSKNCKMAVQKAKEIGMRTIAFTRTDGEICGEVDLSIEVPSDNTQHIQECHMIAYHIVTELVEEKMFGGKS